LRHGSSEEKPKPLLFPLLLVFPTSFSDPLITLPCPFVGGREGDAAVVGVVAFARLEEATEERVEGAGWWGWGGGNRLSVKLLLLSMAAVVVMAVVAVVVVLSNTAPDAASVDSLRNA
jgi:hypothetical protein